MGAFSTSADCPSLSFLTSATFRSSKSAPSGSATVGVTTRSAPWGQSETSSATVSVRSPAFAGFASFVQVWRMGAPYTCQRPPGKTQMPTSPGAKSPPVNVAPGGTTRRISAVTDGGTGRSGVPNSSTPPLRTTTLPESSRVARIREKASVPSISSEAISRSETTSYSTAVPFATVTAAPAAGVPLGLQVSGDDQGPFFTLRTRPGAACTPDCRNAGAETKITTTPHVAPATHRRLLRKRRKTAVISIGRFVSTFRNRRGNRRGTWLRRPGALRFIQEESLFKMGCVLAAVPGRTAKGLLRNLLEIDNVDFNHR